MIGWVAVAAGLAGEKSGTTQSTHLYTEPDATVAGGIRAVIVATPIKPVRHVFATGADDPSRCYKGAVDNDGLTVTFRGLPPAKYDLVVVFDDAIAEGFTLSRTDGTLTDADRRSIEDAIMKSVPFFDTKQIHRCRGVTGSDGKAACVLQELRTKTILTQAATELTGYQIRSLKLAMLEEVGGGRWQLGRTREILRTEVAPYDVRGLLSCRYHQELSDVRVTDAVKDLGELRLNLQVDAP